MLLLLPFCYYYYYYYYYCYCCFYCCAGGAWSLNSDGENNLFPVSLSHSNLRLLSLRLPIVPPFPRQSHCHKIGNRWLTMVSFMLRQLYNPLTGWDQQSGHFQDKISFDFDRYGFAPSRSSSPWTSRRTNWVSYTWIYTYKYIHTRVTDNCEKQCLTHSLP